MSNDKDKIDQTKTAQPGSQGQHGKGQSNPGGWDQQSSSSMERGQAEQDRERHQQQKNNEGSRGEDE